VTAGELLFIAGQVAVDASRRLVGAGDLDAQARQVFRNLLTALKSAGASYRNVAQFTTYLVNSRDIPKLRAFRERYYPKFFPDGQYPPNTLLVVDRLAGEEMLIEISAIAVLD
jgi:enamine deaminase RidA (YjgF/YER057c/UK114 family)